MAGDAASDQSTGQTFTQVTLPAQDGIQDAPGTWVLQDEAASRARCSVSAIRKWRRTGVVAGRTVLTGGVERVEVRLEDVLARAEQSRLRRAPAAAQEPVVPPGTAIIAVSDLEALFERIADAEARAARAEQLLQSAETEARVAVARLTELRAQLHARQAAEERPPPAATEPSPAPAPTPPPARPRGRSPGAAGRTEPDLGAVADNLRRLYARLGRHRAERGAAASRTRAWARDLAAYDAALVTACRALRVPTPDHRPEGLSPPERASLTRSLAGAGLDVRRADPPPGA